MKVLHINTTSKGGSGQAAIRLHQSLLELGIDSKILFLKDKRDNKEEQSFLNFGEKLNTVLFKMQVYRFQKFLNKGRSKQKEDMTFCRSLFDVHKHPWVKEADIINLHWISNFVNLPSFIPKMKKPIVWTLHDIWPFTGGCHYSNGCKKFTSTCNSCPEVAYSSFRPNPAKEQELKWNLFKGMDLQIICLSEWMRSLSKSSKILGSFNHHLIRNSINFDVFTLRDKATLLEKYKIPKSKVVFFFAAGSLSNYRKGFDLLLKSLQILEDSNLDYYIISAGRSNDALDALQNHKNVGVIRSEEQMSELYSLADAYLLPSREDNLPNVMLESLASGTPVISFAVGGMLDVIENGINGYLAPDLTPESFAESIRTFISNQSVFKPIQIREKALKSFHPSIQGQEYIEVYKKSLKNEY